MNNYTSETFESIWSFVDSKNESYTVLHETLTDVYKIYKSEDIEEIAYTNFAVKNGYIKLSGIFFDADRYFFTVANDNLLHNETGPAIFLPCGLNNFKPKEEFRHFLVYGKIMSQYTWLTWVRDTSYWPRVMANFLGSKNQY